jgi:hypothetical protein
VVFLLALVSLVDRRRSDLSNRPPVQGFDSLECISGGIINAYRLNNLHLQPIALTGYTDQRAFPLRDVIGKGPKIVLQYSDLNCDICVDSALSYFTSFLKKAGRSNAIIIASTDNRRLLSFFVRINHVDPAMVYFINNKDLGGLYGMAPPNAPFVYFTDSSLMVADVFLPIKEIPRLSEIYYEEMLAKHFRK